MASPPTATSPLRTITHGAADTIFRLVLMTGTDEVQARVLETARRWAILDAELTHPNEIPAHETF